MVYKGMARIERAGKLKAYQEAYPAMTGVQPTGGVQAPQMGDAIKNLMLGTAY
jgi:hypothetical protein